MGVKILDPSWALKQMEHVGFGALTPGLMDSLHNIVDKREDSDDPNNIKPVPMKKGGSVRGDGAARKGKTRGRVR